MGVAQSDRSPTSRPEWAALSAHRAELAEISLASLFEKDAGRAERFSAEQGDLFLDYSKNHIDDRALQLLLALADAVGLREGIRELFSGARVNTSEGRPALHMALRAPAGTRIEVEGRNVVDDVQRVLERMSEFAEAVRGGGWRGHTGRRIRNVVNIGIGGSDLGPRMACRALASLSDSSLHSAFVSNIDGGDFSHVSRDLDPAETLFVVCSKTFTTRETLTNARTAREWLVAGLADEAAVARHFVAVSANAAEVSLFGIAEENRFEIWDWVGGRYSLASAIGLSLMIAIGPAAFREMLAGFHAMDTHFRDAPFGSNLPVLLGLLGLWYAAFWDAESHCILPYSADLGDFPAYLQQLEMESNGKAVSTTGRAVDFATAPILWGGAGSDAQHAFFQLLHQGTRLVPCDFIAFSRSPSSPARHHDLLLANFLAQTRALAFGRPQGDDPQRRFSGNRPSNSLLAPSLSPRMLGQLIALYEHKVFVQARIWGINPFDQWGVELGKQLADEILEEIASGQGAGRGYDASTMGLLSRYLAQRAARK